jgi:hypothetical protein
VTFPLAFATTEYALISNDTRICYRHASGGPRLYYRDTGRKVIPLDGAWLQGGNDDMLAPWAARYLFQNRRIDEAFLRERLSTAILPEDDPAHDQSLQVVQRDPDGFALYVVDLVRGTFSRRVRLAFDALPPFTYGDTEKAALCYELMQAVSPDYARSYRLPDLLRRLGRLYVDVRAVCGDEGSISELLEVGLLLPDANGGVVQRRLGPRPAAEIQGLSDEELNGLLEPVEGLVVGRNVVGTRQGDGVLKPIPLTLSYFWRANRLFVTWAGGSDVVSVKVATSTSDYPAAGTGTASNGQNGSFDAGTFTFGQTVFITVTPYSAVSGGGTQGTSQRLRARLFSIATWIDETTGKPLRTQDFTDGGFAVRAADTAGKEAFDDLYVLSTKTLRVGTVASPSTITKTIRIPCHEFVPEVEDKTWKYDLGIVRPDTAAVLTIFRAPCVLPKGVTIVAARARLYRDNTDPDDAAEVLLYRMVNDESATLLIALTHATTGWATVSGSASQLVGDEFYTLQCELTGGDAFLHARMAWVEVDYTMPSYDKGY